MCLNRWLSQLGSLVTASWRLTIGWLLRDEFIFQGVQFLLLLRAHGRGNLVTSCSMRWDQPGQKPIHSSCIGREGSVRVPFTMLCARPDTLLAWGGVRTNLVQSSRCQANFDTKSLGQLGNLGLFTRWSRSVQQLKNGGDCFPPSSHFLDARALKFHRRYAYGHTMHVLGILRITLHTQLLLQIVFLQ